MRSEQLQFNSNYVGLNFSLVFQYHLEKGVGNEISLIGKVHHVLVNSYRHEGVLYKSDDVEGVYFPTIAKSGSYEVVGDSQGKEVFRSYFTLGLEQEISVYFLTGEIDELKIESYECEDLESNIVLALRSKGVEVHSRSVDHDEFEEFEEVGQDDFSEEERLEKEDEIIEHKEIYVVEEVNGGAISGSSLGHLLSLFGLTVDSEEMIKASSPEEAQVEFEYNAAEIKALKEQYSQEYWESIDRLSSTEQDSDAGKVFALAGMLVNTGAEIARQKKLNTEIRRLEKEYEKVIDEFYLKNKKSYEQGEKFAIKQAAMAVSKLREQYYKDLYLYYHCSKSYASNNFSYQFFNWMKPGCNQPEQNFKVGYEFDNVDYLHAATRKREHYQFAMSEKYDPIYIQAFKESSSYYLKRVLKRDSTNSRAIFARASFRTEVGAMIDDIQLAHSLDTSDKEIISSLKDINEKYRDQYFDGIKLNSVETLQRIESYELNEPLINEEGLSPQALAIKHDKLKVFEYLVSNDELEVFKNNYLLASVKDDSEEICSFLINEKEADVNGKVRLHGSKITPIEMAVNRESKKALRLLFENDVKLKPFRKHKLLAGDAGSKFSFLALRTAIEADKEKLFQESISLRKPKEKDNPEAIQELNFYGGNSRLLDSSGRAPIHYLTEHSCYYIQRELHGLMVDVNQKDKQGKTVLFYAVQKDQFSIVKYILKEPSLVNLNEKGEKGMTLLHVAAAYDRGYLIELLLKAGADQDIVNDKGQFPLDVAKSYRSKSAKRALKGKIIK